MPFSNTLLQGLPTTVSPGHKLVLSFDWVFGGQETGSPDENVQICLVSGGNFYNAAGALGFLTTATSNRSAPSI